MREVSELVKLLNSRKAWEGPPARPPSFGPEALANLAKAVQAHAQANHSDPHAGPRARLYMVRGYELVSDVLKDANRIIADRYNRRALGLPEEAPGA